MEKNRYIIKDRSPVIYIAAAVILLAIAFVSVKAIVGNAYAKKIPPLPELQSLSAPLKQQLTDAYKQARVYPSADNIGMMGMVYHSSIYYDKAAICYELAIKSCLLYTSDAADEEDSVDFGG